MTQQKGWSQEKAMESASSQVRAQQERDDAFPSLYNMASQNPAPEYSTSSIQPFLHKHSLLLPTPLIEQYRTTLQHSTFMGLFPEIGRAWVTMDEKLFLWNYMDGDDFVAHESGSQPIISVGLVRPRPNLFQPSIEYLICIANLSVISIVCVIRNSNGELSLLKTDILVPSNNVSMVKIVGTKNGRIFMAGSNGSVYEFVYHAPKSLFRPQHQLLERSVGWGDYMKSYIYLLAAEPTQMADLVVDPNRNLLYTLAHKKNVTDSSKDRSIISVYNIDGDLFEPIGTLSNISTAATSKTPKNFIGTRGLCDIISIFAVTEGDGSLTDVNLVAVTAAGARIYITMDKSTGVQGALEVTHMRVISDPSSTIRATSCYYKAGLLAVVDSPPAEDQAKGDKFLCFSPDLAQYGFSPNLALHFVETKYSSQCNAMTWAIDEVPMTTDPHINPANELVTQYLTAPREVLVLTNKHLNVYVRQRPVDQLEKILRENSNVAEFIKAYKESEVCAMSLHLACTRDQLDAASILFAKCRGVPTVAAANPIGENVSVGTAIVLPTIKYSPGHNGLVAYISRLLRPLWPYPVLMEISKNTYAPRWNNNMLISISNQLAALNQYLQRSGWIPTNITRRDSARTDQEAQQIENRSLADLKELLVRSLEAVRLFSNVGPQLKKVPGEELQHLVPFTFGRFVSLPEGVDAARKLTNSIVGVWNKSDEQVDSMSEVLASNCGGFFSTVERELVKANELMRRALQASPNELQQKDALMREALGKYLAISPNVNLAEICPKFAVMRNYIAVVQLVDANMRAMDISGDDSTSRDSKHLEGALVFAHLRVILDSMMSDLTIPADERDKVIAQIFHCQNDSLNHHLYQWYLENNLKSELLQYKQPSLETFLNKHDHVLLSEYYIMNGEYMKGALLMSQHAREPGNRSINDRINFLTKALIAVNSQRLYSPPGFERELQDLLEVARVQCMALGRIPDSDANLKELVTYSLLDISVLFNKVAKPNHMCDIMLLCLHASQHNEEVLVADLWRRLVSQNDTKLDSLLGAVSQLGIHMKPGSFAFPIPFVASLLERVNMMHPSSDKLAVVRTFLRLSTPWAELFTAYESVFANSDLHERTAKIHLYSVLGLMAAEWHGEIQKEPFERQREFMAMRIDTKIDGWVTALNGMPEVAPAAICVEELRKTRDRLRLKTANRMPY